jgi:hypothetical protein
MRAVNKELAGGCHTDAKIRNGGWGGKNIIGMVILSLAPGMPPSPLKRRLGW